MNPKCWNEQFIITEKYLCMLFIQAFSILVVTNNYESYLTNLSMQKNKIIISYYYLIVIKNVVDKLIMICHKIFK